MIRIVIICNLLLGSVSAVALAATLLTDTIATEVLAPDIVRNLEGKSITWAALFVATLAVSANVWLVKMLLARVDAWVAAIDDLKSEWQRRPCWFQNEHSK